MYDIIGDIHGCYDELIKLVQQLGYQKKEQLYNHPQKRKMVFLGDLTDRGPDSLSVIEFVVRHVRKNAALYVPGNHCDKLYRFFIGRPVQQKHGLETTVAEFHAAPVQRQKKIRDHFIWLVEQSPLYFVLDERRLVVVHAGIRQSYIGRDDSVPAVRKFCLYGDIAGKTDETGFPVRRDWTKQYKGKKWIVFGHTPVKEPRVFNRTINIDTGCVFGGQLTALRYPEFKTVSVPSSQPYQPEKFRLKKSIDK